MPGRQIKRLRLSECGCTRLHMAVTYTARVDGRCPPPAHIRTVFTVVLILGDLIMCNYVLHLACPLVLIAAHYHARSSRHSSPLLPAPLTGVTASVAHPGARLRPRCFLPTFFFRFSFLPSLPVPSSFPLHLISLLAFL